MAKGSFLLKFNSIKNRVISDQVLTFNTSRKAIDYSRFLMSNNLCKGKPELIERKYF